MTGQTDTAGEPIQLHFCQRCGISIPDADVETGRAKAAPGGYVCVGCIYQDRDATLTPAPRVSRPAVATRPSSGPRAVSTIAILYLIGVTTFLLVKELNREPPELVLPAPLATAQDVRNLSAKVEAVDEETRKALGRLKSNDEQQREDLLELNSGVNRLQERDKDLEALLKAQHKDLAESVEQIAERTVGMDRSAKEILRGVLELRAGAQTRPARETDQPPPKIDNKAQPDQPKETGTKTPPPVVDPEKKKLVDKFVKQLLDRGVDKQSRFNAAVQLGDLMDPSSLDALVQALKRDPYDLVRRAAAYSLGMLGKHAVRAIPDLIQQMDDKEEYVGYMCERALSDITKAVMGAPVSFDFDPTQPAKKRRSVQQKWEQWWEKNKATLLP